MQLSIPQIEMMSRLLDEALPLDEPGRRLWLEGLSAEYQELAPALRSALLAPAGSNALLTPVAHPLHGGEPGGAADALRPGERVGPYELIRPLGTGGMAQVWLARRADGAFRRDVALKLPTPAQGRHDLAQRFPQERDILASLEHPLIARFYDAGIDAQGLPYFAMEYVRGQPLTTWCDERRLDIDARLALLLQVLEAVQYAHEKRVVHRDIKPSNILVTESGQIRLLDFGIAKLLEMEAAGEAQLTNLFARALTPDYASPEQLRGDAVDARSDIYSLGVLLYELLSGVRPHSGRGLRALGAVAHGHNLIQPGKPSAQIDDTAAAARATTAERLRRRLRGDLDAIALKALSPDPGERYPSAMALAADLRSYTAGRPIEALPAAVTYRLRKAMRRNRVVIVYAGAAAVAIVAAIALAIVAARGHERSYALAAPKPAAAAPAPAPTPVSAAAPAFAGSDASAASVQVAAKSVAVLPFVDLSQHQDQQYFSDGLAEELINHLSHTADLKVIARTSSFQFKGQDEDVRLIAAKLGVAQLLEGSVRKSGDALRITTQLVRASDGVTLWSQTYDGSLTDIFRVQDDIAARVTRALDARLAAPARPVGDAADVAAYNLVLEGDYFAKRRSISDVEKALQLFQQAIALRPDYALPWASLAGAYLRLDEARESPSPYYNARIVAALNRAIQLDPDLMVSYYTRAGFEIAIKWDWAAAQADHERMRALDPGSYLLPIALGDTALVSGHPQEAVAQYQRAVQLSPLDAVALQALGNALCAAGRAQECLSYGLRLRQLHPELRDINSFVGHAYLMLGQLPEALRAMQREPKQDSRLAGLAAVYAAMGRHGDSDAALKSLEEHYAQDDDYEIAQLHAYRGETDAAFEWLQHCKRVHNFQLLFIKSDPFLHNIAGDPRFQNLLASLRLPQ
ncbi:MAG TPA: protein kinase [Steroidobacteraceae bacterium]|nr:protein kinase [Steroidobacteraceae bacterium]